MTSILYMRHIDDLLTLSFSKEIYPVELSIKRTTDSYVGLLVIMCKNIAVFVVSLFLVTT